MPIGYKLLRISYYLYQDGELVFLLIFRVHFLSDPSYVFKLLYAILMFICIYKLRCSWIINLHNNPMAVEIEKQD